MGQSYGPWVLFDQEVSLN